MTRKKNIQWGQGMAKVGNIGSIFNLVFGWVFMIGGVILGILLIVYAAKGKTLFGSGICEAKNGDYTTTCDYEWSEAMCKSQGCVYNNKLDNKTGYIVGGIFSILLGIGILFLARFMRQQVKKDKNFAAVFGAGFLAEGIASSFNR